AARASVSMSSSVGALSAANAGSWLGSVIGLRPPPCPYPPRAGERTRTIKVTREADEAPNPPPLPRRGEGGEGACALATPVENGHQRHSRTSTKRPAIAVAAAMAGETRWVRPLKP